MEEQAPVSESTSNVDNDNVKSPSAKKSKASTSTSEVAQETPGTKENIPQESFEDLQDENADISKASGSLQSPSSLSLLPTNKSQQAGCSAALLDRNHLTGSKKFNFTAEEWENINKSFSSFKTVDGHITETILRDNYLNAVEKAKYYLDLKIIDKVQELVSTLAKDQDSSPDDEDAKLSKDGAARGSKGQTIDYIGFCQVIAYYRDWCIDKLASGIKEKLKNQQNDKFISNDNWRLILTDIFSPFENDQFRLCLETLAEKYVKNIGNEVFYDHDNILKDACSYVKLVPTQAGSSST